MKKMTRSAATCTETSLSIKETFEDWTSFTEHLSMAVVRSRGMSLATREYQHAKCSEDAAFVEKDEREEEKSAHEKRISVAVTEEKIATDALTEAQNSLERAIANREVAAQHMSEVCKSSILIMLNLAKQQLIMPSQMW